MCHSFYIYTFRPHKFLWKMWCYNWAPAPVAKKSSCQWARASGGPWEESRRQLQPVIVQTQEAKTNLPDIHYLSPNLITWTVTAKLILFDLYKMCCLPVHLTFILCLFVHPICLFVHPVCLFVHPIRLFVHPICLFVTKFFLSYLWNPHYFIQRHQQKFWQQWRYLYHDIHFSTVVSCRIQLLQVLSLPVLLHLNVCLTTRP